MIPRWSVLLVSLLAGCQQEPEPAPVVPVDDPAARVQAIRLDLHAAQQAWSDGRREEARARVLSTYATQFEPLEPALRQQDPVKTLRLEYAFGQLATRMSKRGEALALAQVVQEITRGTDELVAALPVPAGAPPPVAGPPPGTPTTEPAPIPAHLRLDKDQKAPVEKDEKQGG